MLSRQVIFKTLFPNTVSSVVAKEVSGVKVTLNVTFSSTNDARCLVLPAGNSISTANDVMAHADASPTTQAIGGVDILVAIGGLTKGTQYVAKCAQNGVLSEEMAFTTLDFQTNPFVASFSSTDVTFKMTPIGDGAISCIVLPNDAGAPNASAVMSKTNGQGVYQNIVNALGGVETTFTVFNLQPGLYFDAYCAQIDYVSR